MAFMLLLELRLQAKLSSLDNRQNRNCLNCFAKKLKKCEIAKGLANVETL